jgi:YtkA-like protein
MRRLAVVLALASLAFAGADGTVGPGDAHTIVRKAGYRLEVTITPNHGALTPSTFTVGLTRAGKPVSGTVAIRFAMVAMPMPPLALRLRQVAAGRFQARGTKLTMPGRWRLTFHVVPRKAAPFDVVLLDNARVI